MCIPSTDATVEEAVSFAHGRATWRITTKLPPAELSDADCYLRGRATVAAAGDRGVVRGDGTIAAGEVYPLLTFDIPVGRRGDACRDARLSDHGPIRVEYTQPDTDAPTRFDHAWHQH